MNIRTGTTGGAQGVNEPAWLGPATELAANPQATLSEFVVGAGLGAFEDLIKKLWSSAFSLNRILPLINPNEIHTIVPAATDTSWRQPEHTSRPRMTHVACGHPTFRADEAGRPSQSPQVGCARHTVGKHLDELPIGATVIRSRGKSPALTDPCAELDHRYILGVEELTAYPLPRKGN